MLFVYADLIYVIILANAIMLSKKETVVCLMFKVEKIC